MAEGMELITFDEAADRLGLSSSRLRQLLRERELIAVRDEDGKRKIPAEFLITGPDGVEIVRGLSGLLTLLADARFSEEETVAWLFTPDDSLPGTPVEAMRAGRSTEVKRRAQALAW